MIIVCYDFVSNKRRSRFSKFLKQYGHKVQYSVYTLENSQRILNLVLAEIEHKYKANFSSTDHILIFQVCEACKKKIIRYGAASHEVEDVIYF